MQKLKVCSMLMMAGALVACSKDKHHEPMSPAAGQQTDQRAQTAPTYQEQQVPAEPSMESGEWQAEVQEPQAPTADQPAVSDPWAAPSQPQAGSLHARTLAETSCRRELRCDRIGENKKHATVEECESTIIEEGNKHFASCPSGVSSEALTECVTAIQAKSCDKPMEKLSEYDECTVTVLCAKAK